MGLHISGSVALVGCLASLSMALLQVSTVQPEVGGVMMTKPSAGGAWHILICEIDFSMVPS